IVFEHPKIPRISFFVKGKSANRVLFFPDAPVSLPRIGRRCIIQPVEPASDRRGIDDRSGATGVLACAHAAPHPSRPAGMTDRPLLYAAAFVRALATGMIGVLMGLYLARIEFSPASIGT